MAKKKARKKVAKKATKKATKKKAAKKAAKKVRRGGVTSTQRLPGRDQEVLAVMPIADLVGAKADYNPRTISGHDYERLRASIERFGFVEPVVFNRRTGRVVGGHQRIEAAESLGLEELPVRVVDLSESEERALNVSLNRISGDWDWEKLSDILRDLDDPTLIAYTGLSEQEIGPLLKADWDPPEPDGSLDGMGASPGGGADEEGTLTVSFRADDIEMVQAVIELEREEHDGADEEMTDGDLLANFIRATMGEEG